MKSLKTLGLLALIPLAFLYWPLACVGGSGVHQPIVDTESARAPAELVQPRSVGATLALPHPAFAYAGPSNGGLTVADVAERVTPSVVNVSSERRAKERGGMSPFGFGFPFGFGHQPEMERKEKGLGSGVVVSADGVILTNNHVIEDAEEITITTAEGKEYAAEVVGADQKSDVAVLRVKGDASGLKPLSFGDSKQLRLGDIVLAIGNPFGIGQTVTMGIVSATGRADVGIAQYEDFIQTDAAINPGNSGGALVNMKGELVGINTAILSRSGGYQGIGFAIPSAMTQPIMGSLLEHGKVVRGYLGVSIQDIDADMAEALGAGAAGGVLIADVNAGGAADKAGLKRGDVVRSVDGVKTDSTGRLRNLIAGKGAGKTVRLLVLRDGKERTVDVGLGELPEKVAPVAGSHADSAASPLGLKLADATPELRARLQQPNGNAKVIVVGVERGGPAAEVGIRPGDGLLELNRVKLKGVADAKARLGKAKGSLLLLVERGGVTRYVALKR